MTGLRKPTGGRIVSMAGVDVTGWNPRALYEAGLAHVPGDRHRWAMIMSFPLEDNLVLTSYYRPPFARGLVRQDDAIDALGERADRALRHPDALANCRRRRRCRAGNQQKAVVAREFSGEPKLLVLDQPTRGLDVGSIEFIHSRAIEMRDAGAAILLVSAELDEVLELSDRIAVMYRGELVATLDGRTANKEEVGLLMATGGREPDPSRGRVVSRHRRPASRAVLAARADRSGLRHRRRAGGVRLPRPRRRGRHHPVVERGHDRVDRLDAAGRGLRRAAPGCRSVRPIRRLRTRSSRPRPWSSAGWPSGSASRPACSTSAGRVSSCSPRTAAAGVGAAMATAPAPIAHHGWRW